MQAIEEVIEETPSVLVLIDEGGGKREREEEGGERGEEGRGERGGGGGGRGGPFRSGTRISVGGSGLIRDLIRGGQTP